LINVKEHFYFDQTNVLFLSRINLVFKTKFYIWLLPAFNWKTIYKFVDKCLEQQRVQNNLYLFCRCINGGNIWKKITFPPSTASVLANSNFWDQYWFPNVEHKSLIMSVVLSKK